MVGCELDPFNSNFGLKYCKWKKQIPQQG